MRFWLLLALTACTATGYHARSDDGGYVDTQLESNSFQVSFQGNSHTAPEQVDDFALLRSAEVARAHGYGFFIVKLRQSSSTSSGGGASSTRTSSRRVRDGSSLDADTTTSGRWSAPGRTLMIVCFKEKPSREGVYEVAEVVQSMTARYKLQ